MACACANALPETRPEIQHIIKIPEEIDPVFPDPCCIYKVPIHLLKLNAEAYTPQFISIGPIHSNNAELQNQEKHKQRYFHAFWKRLSNKQALAFVQYKAYLEQNREKIGNRYSITQFWKEKKFVDMILLDSVFILELFLRKSNRSEQLNDYLFTTSWVCKVTQRDLLLLENQLPMFVLEELHTRVFLRDNVNCKEDKKLVSFIELAFNYFEDFYPHKGSQKVEMIENCKSCNHFTDLIRYTYLPRQVQVNGVNRNPSQNFTPCPVEYVLRTATKLNEAGVSFEKVQGKSYLDMNVDNTPILSWFLCFGCLPFSKFFKARLQFPHLKVDQVTECVLRNLIALEQCHYSEQPLICNYVSLIDSLIHTQDDVELLVDKEVIVHELGSHMELATMINGLCKHVVVTSNYYCEIAKELNQHYNNCWKRYMGMLRSVYFRDPWRLSSTIVGAAIFLFAIINFLKVVGLLFHPKH